MEDGYELKSDIKFRWSVVKSLQDRHSKQQDEEILQKIQHEENHNHYTTTISVKFEGVREIDITLGSLTVSYERSTCWPLHKRTDIQMNLSTFTTYQPYQSNALIAPMSRGRPNPTRTTSTAMTAIKIPAHVVEFVSV